MEEVRKKLFALTDDLQKQKKKVRELNSRLTSLENFIFLDNDALKILYEKYKHRSDIDEEA